MRIGLLKSLTMDELSLLTYIMNNIEPVSLPKRELPHELLWYKHDYLLWKVSQSESKLTEEGKVVYNSLVKTLNKTWEEEIKEYENSSKPVYTQTVFSF